MTRMHLLAATLVLFFGGCFAGSSLEVVADGGVQLDATVVLFGSAGERAVEMEVEVVDGGEPNVAPDASMPTRFGTGRPGGDGDGVEPMVVGDGDGDGDTPVGAANGTLCYAPDDCASGYCTCAQTSCQGGLVAGLCAVDPDACTLDDTTCDGLDDDCDGRTDEDYIPVDCGNPQCMPGYTDCTAGELSCYGEVCL